MSSPVVSLFNFRNIVDTIIYIGWLGCYPKYSIQGDKYGHENDYECARLGTCSDGITMGVPDGQERNTNIGGLMGQNFMGLLMMLLVVVAGVFLADWLKGRIGGEA